MYERVLAERSAAWARLTPDTLNARNSLAAPTALTGRARDAIRLAEARAGRVRARAGTGAPGHLAARSELARVYLSAGSGCATRPSPFTGAPSPGGSRSSARHPGPWTRGANLARAVPGGSEAHRRAAAARANRRRPGEVQGRDHPIRSPRRGNLAAAYVDADRLRDAIGA